jgi:hypothetical protein
MATITKTEITDLLKDNGLDLAEDMAVTAVKSAFKILLVIVPKVSTGLGAIIGPMIELIEPKVLAMLDAIDGKDDEGY